MTIRDQVKKLAAADVGYTEARGNRTKFWERMKPEWNGYAWCGAFAGDVWRRAGLDVRDHVNIFYVPAIIAWAKKIGAWKTSNPKTGDLVCFGFGKSHGVHVGIATPDPSASGYVSIEGNTSAGNRGSQSNGGGVYRRYRGRKSILGWVDLDVVAARYLGKAAVETAKAVANKASGALEVDGRLGHATARELQEFLRARGHDLAVDGRLGPDSWRAFQDYLGTPRDGVVSNQSHRHDALGNGIAPRGWDYDGPGAAGSTMVRALQKWVKVGQDGVWGEATTRGLQAKLNAHNAGA